MSYFAWKNQKISSAQTPIASGGWELRPQTPPMQSSIANICLRAGEIIIMSCLRNIN